MNIFMSHGTIAAYYVTSVQFYLAQV